MRTSVAVCLSALLNLLSAVTLLGVANAQVPTRTSEPRLAVPQAEVPMAQPPGQPTAQAPAPPAAAPDTGQPVTAVTGPAGGVTQLPAGTTQPTSSTTQAATATDRGYGAGKFALTLEGAIVGWMSAMEGGSATSEVVSERPGPDHTSKKHLAGVKYEDIAVKTGLDSKQLNDWIAQTLKGNFSRKNGSVVAASYDYKAMSELQFFQGLITEVTFPTLDAASRDAASITVKLAPEYTRLQGGSGANLGGGGSKVSQKRWLPSSFRFAMDGLEAGSSKINRVESFTVSLKVADNPVGEARDYEKTPAQLVFPNLKVTLAESHANDWVQWHDDFVIKGNNGDDKEKNGSIVYLDPTMTTELGRVRLFNCGIFRLAPPKVEAGSESVRRFEAELYCERMEFEVPGGS